jgi:hypothetical protein
LRLGIPNLRKVSVKSTCPVSRLTATLRPEREADAVLWRHMAEISVTFPFLILVTYGWASTR